VTAETIKIGKFHKIHLQILNQYVSLWLLSDILGTEPLAPAWCRNWTYYRNFFWELIVIVLKVKFCFSGPSIVANRNNCNTNPNPNLNHFPYPANPANCNPNCTVPKYNCANVCEFWLQDCMICCRDIDQRNDY